MSNPYGLTDENVKNLDKLATYLEGLPADYEHFEMHDFIEGKPRWNQKVVDYMLKNGGLYENCGAPGCALGHGPSAGILARQGVDILKDFEGDSYVDWDTYSTRFVAYDIEEARPRVWDFFFGGAWSDVDNTHQGAAARIRFVLAGKKFRSDFCVWRDQHLEDAMEEYHQYIK